ncbi:polysaccharide pyruvyl transferase family protein [Isoptericola sp. NEAU-Y5]|uniref:Polysaccharide pyruvyl transferase family protein n=1 Tax=Isoptericola luteus TaxID=2879484 RepID=A0ABS7ZCW9_9MICO|nr:polysaccharide pyruvyl transferase family protein [Isoptericola sp. NEAU-Y5]MCA5892889.1 polysaccharide pyruvyl transferase family protein [Isoptericola sp. NEAU-Y5]
MTPVARDAPARPPAAPVRRVGLLGAFGIGNRGNDVTLRAFADALTTADVGDVVEPVAVCPAPATVEATGVRAAAWTRPRSGSSLLARLTARLGDLVWTWRTVRGLDAVVLAGGGLLEVTRLRASTTAWTVAAYTWAGHLQHKPVVFWSVGGDELPHGPARLLVRAALRGATTVAVRDDHSRRAVEALDGRAPATVHDVVLALPVEDEPRPSPTGPLGTGATVAVGVFNARGATAADGAALDADRYESELCRTVCGLVDQGDDVVLLGGAAIDAAVIDDIVARCEHDLGPRACQVHRGAYDDYPTAHRTLAGADLAVVARYHSAIAALTAGTPTVSVGYGPKNRELMAQFGQEEYCADLPRARADEVLALVERLRRRVRSEATAIAGAHRRLQATTRAELDTLAALLAHSPTTIRR